MKKTFVAFLEPVVGEGAATGAMAKKICQIAPRFVWCDYDNLVLPEMPEQDFLKYVNEFKKVPQIVVPSGIDSERLWMLDSITQDDRVRQMITGNLVDYYISDSRLYEAVEKVGGHYVGGKPNQEAIHNANCKELYKQLIADLLLPVPGIVGYGIIDIAEKVEQRLRLGESVFVRIVHCGGGLGNKIFRAEHCGTQYTSKEVIETLRNAHPTFWERAKALIEPVLQLKSSPGVAFHTEDGVLYDFLQVTRNGDYVGAYSPVPENVCDPIQLIAVGNGLATQLRNIGFHGSADTDLGVLKDGRIVGFEINGRKDGVWHGIEAGQVFHGPWNKWRQNGVCAKMVDTFYLRDEYEFSDLLKKIASICPLASLEHPFGVIITIPPKRKLVGIEIFGHSKKEADELYNELNCTIGDQRKNFEDH